MQCTVVHCTAAKYNAVQCSAVQCSAVQCSAVQCSAAKLSAVSLSGWETGGVLWPVRLRTTEQLLNTGLLNRTVLYCTVLSLYLDERRGVEGNTSIRLREFPRAQPKGTPETKCWYFPVLSDLSQGTDIVKAQP